MTVAIIIQARIGSTRLPGKVLLPLGDRSVLGQVVARVSEAKLQQQIWIATTSLEQDDEIEREAGRLDVHSFRGSEHDVLSRYYESAVLSGADHIVRITADCPLIDPQLIDQIIAVHLETGADYTSNVQRRSYPRGLVTEIFTMAALERAHKHADTALKREHVTPYLYEEEGRFHMEHVIYKEDCSSYRWTLDTPEDWRVINEIYKQLYAPGRMFTWEEALLYVRAHPEIASWNVEIEQKKWNG